MKLNECYLPDGVAGPGAVQDGGEQERRPQHLPRREQGLGLRPARRAAREHDLRLASLSLFNYRGVRCPLNSTH